MKSMCLNPRGESIPVKYAFKWQKSVFVELILWLYIALYGIWKNIVPNLSFGLGDLTKVEGEMKRCILDCYKKTDEDFLKLASKA